MTEPYAISRPDEKGEVDDVAISCDSFRLERMRPDLVWVACYRDGKQVAFFIGRKGSKLTITMSADDLGCVDDTPSQQTTVEKI